MAAADMVASVATVDVVVRDLSADGVELVLEPQPAVNNAPGTTAGGRCRAREPCRGHQLSQSVAASPLVAESGALLAS